MNAIICVDVISDTKTSQTPDTPSIKSVVLQSPSVLMSQVSFIYWFYLIISHTYLSITPLHTPIYTHNPKTCRKT